MILRLLILIILNGILTQRLQDIIFEQPMVLSTGELSFIDRHKENYLIHRIYSINDEPKFKICNNIFRISDIFLPNLEIFDNSLNDNGLSIRNLNLAVPTASANS